jgi:hypothetical protein
MGREGCTHAASCDGIAYKPESYLQRVRCRRAGDWRSPPTNVRLREGGIGVAEFVDTTQRNECWGEQPAASARGFERRDDETLKPRAGRRVYTELDLTPTLRGVVIED